MSGIHKNENNTEVTATQPDFALKQKLGLEWNIREAFNDETIAAAESVIQESKKDFFGDAEERLHAMESAYRHATTAQNDYSAQIQTIETHTLSLKGQAETLGFELMAHTSKSLYEFCYQRNNTTDKQELIVIRKHLDTIKLILREHLQGDGGAMGKELIRNLHLLVEKYS